MKLLSCTALWCRQMMCKWQLVTKSSASI
uniref:Uncharacterized protein n=1 Tax=Arundo donax TaxID=35708 RepID=A0A0A9F213_ARUDO